MNNNIRCIILRKNRGVEIQKIHRDNTHFTSRGKIYTIPVGAINLATYPKDKKIVPYAELVYIENNPLPINVTNAKASEFLEITVAKNILSAAAKVKPKGMGLEFLRDLFSSPRKLILLGFGLIVLFALLRGYHVV